MQIESNNRNIIIRPYKKEDRNSVRRISCETSFSGNDRYLFFTDDEILADLLTIYYTDYEPESAFVAECNGEVAGYIIGTKDVIKMQKIFKKKIVPRVISKIICKMVFLRKRNIVLFWNMCRSFIKGEFKLPDYSLKYPATLHINIDREFRGDKLGAKLINHYLKYLRIEDVSGVSFGTMSESAKRFFSNMGFKILYKIKQTYMDYLVKEDLTYYIFGRTL